MKEFGKLAAIAAMVLVGLIAYDKLGRDRGGSATPAPIVAVDLVAVDLGQKYRASYEAAGLAAIEAVVTSPATTTAELGRAQRDTLDAGLKAAAQAIIAEQTRRFGAVGTLSGGGGVLGLEDVTVRLSQPTEAVRAFYRDLATGYKKGGR